MYFASKKVYSGPPAKQQIQQQHVPQPQQYSPFTNQPPQPPQSNQQPQQYSSFSFSSNQPPQPPQQAQQQQAQQQQAQQPLYSPFSFQPPQPQQAAQYNPFSFPPQVPPQQQFAFNQPVVHHYPPPPPVIISPPIQPETANTNILSIDLGSLSKGVKLFTGDPNICTICAAIFNAQSVLKPLEDGAQLWVCEFCGHENNVRIEEEEIPKGEQQSVDYMLSPATEKTLSLESSKIVIFCIDVSGSMCITSEIEGKHKLRGDRIDQLQSLNEGAVDQYTPGQRRNVTYVSRLQCVQAAIESQLETLKLTYPNSRVGLVVFSNDVTIIGDGSIPPIVITGDKLYNYDTLIQIASNYQLVNPISQTKDKLVKSLYELSESGSTALGPAVVVSVSMLQKFPGSNIVLATDGLANTGVGSMDSPEVMPAANQFYDEISFFAKQKGISINVVGIKGDQLNISNLGKLADITSGSVDLVDPLQITQNFASVLQSSLVATSVAVKLLLHKAFKAPADGEWTQPPGDKHYVERNVGNAYEDTEITAEFELQSEELLNDLFKDNAKKEVPFQVQIEYIAPSGMKCLRVISRNREITMNQTEAAAEVDLPILGMHVNNKTAKLAEQGDIMLARRTQQQYSDLMNANISNEGEKQQYSAWNDEQVDLFKSPVILAKEQKQQEFIQQQPQAQPQNSIFDTISNFFSPTSNTTTTAPANTNVQANSNPFSFFSNPSSIQEYDDSTSNQIYQHKDMRKNKKQWTQKRKF